MAKNIPSEEMYEQISEWLRIYHSDVSASEKEKTKALIVTQMYPVIKRIAKTIARRAYDPIDDLTQAGFIGLLKAIDKYDEEKNDNFRVYAGYLIIGEMKHYIRDKLDMIRVPRYIQELTIRINNFTRDLTLEEVRSLTTEEVATALDVSTSQVDAVMMVERRRTTLSFDEVYRNDTGSLCYEELLSNVDYKEQSMYEDVRIIFEDVINKLSPDEKVLIDMYYQQDMSQKEIADAMLLTPMAVSRKIKSAFEHIACLVAENTSSHVQKLQENTHEDMI